MLLRLEGSGRSLWQRLSNWQGLDKSQYRIMCLGDSKTYLGGEDAYPSQLEKILNQRGGARQFKVINQGFPGADSQAVLEALVHKGWLKEFNPDMVVLMMGFNDAARLERSKQGSWGGMLNELKVLKMLAGFNINEHLKDWWQRYGKYVLRTSVRKDIVTPKEGIVPEEYVRLMFAGVALAHQGEYAQAENIFLALTQTVFDQSFTDKAWGELGNVYLLQGKYRQYVDVLKRTLDRDFNDYWANLNVLKLCEHSLLAREESVRILEELIAKGKHKDSFYNLLGKCYEKSQDVKQARYYFDKAKEIVWSEYNPVTKAKYQEVIALLIKAQIQPVVMQYPLKPLEPLKALLSSSTHYDQLIFVNNEDIFKQALMQSSYEEYFTDGFEANPGHCTPKGNKLLATQLADIILRHLNQ